LEVLMPVESHEGAVCAVHCTDEELLAKEQSGTGLFIGNHAYIIQTPPTSPHHPGLWATVYNNSSSSESGLIITVMLGAPGFLDAGTAFLGRSGGWPLRHSRSHVIQPGMSERITVEYGPDFPAYPATGAPVHGRAVLWSIHKRGVVLDQVYVGLGRG